MMSGVSDIVLARNELARRLRDDGADGDVAGRVRRLSSSIADMRDAITRTRMQRIDALFSPLPRMVRDLAAELGKQVPLDVDGGDVELDREMIEMIRDPLTPHHPQRDRSRHRAARRARAPRASRRPAARVAARQSGNQILIEIADDGRGIDPRAARRASALASGR